MMRCTSKGSVHLCIQNGEPAGGIRELNTVAWLQYLTGITVMWWDSSHTKEAARDGHRKFSKKNLRRRRGTAFCAREPCECVELCLGTGRS